MIRDSDSFRTRQLTTITVCAFAAVLLHQPTGKAQQSLAKGQIATSALRVDAEVYSLPIEQHAELWRSVIDQVKPAVSDRRNEKRFTAADRSVAGRLGVKELSTTQLLELTAQLSKKSSACRFSFDKAQIPYTDTCSYRLFAT